MGFRYTPPEMAALCESTMLQPRLYLACMGTAAAFLTVVLLWALGVSAADKDYGFGMFWIFLTNWTCVPPLSPCRPHSAVALS